MEFRYHVLGRVDWYPAGAASAVQHYLIHDARDPLIWCILWQNNWNIYIMYISKTVMPSAFLPGILEESDCEEFHCHLQNSGSRSQGLLN